jgi:hypothetical protein
MWDRAVVRINTETCLSRIVLGNTRSIKFIKGHQTEPALLSYLLYDPGSWNVSFNLGYAENLIVGVGGGGQR